MSDNILRIVPRDPCFRPAEGAEVNVVNVLKTMIPHHDSIKVTRHDEIVFMDCGENFKRASCPVCNSDLTGKWSDWMDASYESRFQNREIDVPCCGATIDLNDLRIEYSFCHLGSLADRVFSLFPFEQQTGSSFIFELIDRESVGLPLKCTFDGSMSV